MGKMIFLELNSVFTTTLSLILLILALAVNVCKKIEEKNFEKPDDLKSWIFFFLFLSVLYASLYFVMLSLLLLDTQHLVLVRVKDTNSLPHPLLDSYTWLVTAAPRKNCETYQSQRWKVPTSNIWNRQEHTQTLESIFRIYIFLALYFLFNFKRIPNGDRKECSTELWSCVGIFLLVIFLHQPVLIRRHGNVLDRTYHEKATTKLWGDQSCPPEMKINFQIPSLWNSHSLLKKLLEFKD